jgi:ABC-type polysaccharide/polyol phosphate export permease
LILFYADRISPAIVFIPVVAVVQFTFTMALGLILASLNVFFRDVGNLARHILRLWFYLSPALYGAETIATLDATQPAAATAMRLNPFFTILESYRDAIYYERAPDFVLLGIVFGASLILLIVGTIFFKRLEPSFAKVL